MLWIGVAADGWVVVDGDDCGVDVAVGSDSDDDCGSCCWLIADGVDGADCGVGDVAAAGVAAGGRWFTVLIVVLMVFAVVC